MRGSPPVSIRLLTLNEIPDDVLETASVTSDSTSIVSSSDRRSLPTSKEFAEGSEGDAPVDTISLLSENSAADSLEVGSRPTYPKGLRKSRINISRQELVCVTHIRSPANFMIQKVAVLEDLRGLSDKIRQYCRKPASMKDIPLSGLEPEAIVLAQFSNDEKWYRARVLSFEVNEADPLQSQVEVMYVDFGNSEIIPLSRIRQIPPKFVKLPALAMRCALYDILPANDVQEWTIDSIKAFAGMINDKPMLCLVKREKDGILYVDLSVPPDDRMAWDQPVSMRDALVFLEHAYFKSSQGTPIYPGGPVPRVTRQFLKSPRASHGTCATCIISHVNSPHDFFIQLLGEEAQYLTNMMRGLQEHFNADKGDLWTIFCPQKGMICAAQYTADEQWYRAEVVSMPGCRNVEVMYVDYGNTEIIPFWRLKKISNDFCVLPIQALRCSLMDVQPVGTIKGWQEEAITFMRQLVFKPLSATIVGYGSSQVLIILNETSTGQDICINAALVHHDYAQSTGPASLMDELQVVPEKLVSTSPPSEYQNPLKVAQQSLKMGLDITSEGIKYMHSSTSSSPISVVSSVARSSRKTKSESPKPFVAQPGSYKSVEKKAPKKHRDPGPKFAREVVISNTVTPGHFFIQICPLDELHEMMVTLQNHYRGRELDQLNWSPGDFCVALRPEDVRWYRAKILEISGEEVKVFMPDYGFTETVSERHLRRLDDEFHSQPAFSLQCHFAEICPAGDITKWSQTSCEIFQELIKDQTTYMKTNGKLENDSLPIDILLREFLRGDALNPDRIEYNSFSQKLLKKGVALPNRKTIGMLVAAEGAKGSLVTIRPKPLVPSVDSVAKSQEKDAEAAEATESQKQQQDSQEEQHDSQKKQQDSQKEQQDFEKLKEMQERSEKELSPINIDELENGAKMNMVNWVDIVDAETSGQTVIENKKGPKDSSKEKVDDKAKQSDRMDRGEPAQTIEKSLVKPSLKEVLDGKKSSNAAAANLSDAEIGLTNEESAIDKDNNNAGDSEKLSTPTKVKRRSKGCSIYEKLQAQLEKKEAQENLQEEPKSDVDSQQNDKSPKQKASVSKGEHSGRVIVKEELPIAFTDPPLPTSVKFEVVPTYVDYKCTIYGHIVPQRESPEGRFGFILKEKTLETILQDNYLERQDLHRAKIPRDGNCLFRAFAQGIHQDQSKQGELRELTVGAMSRDWDVIQESVGADDKESYLTAMRQNGSYGGEPEIQTLCSVLGIQAVIHLGGLKYPIQQRAYGQLGGQQIQLIYISDGNYDGGHYDLAVTSQEEADQVNVVYEKWREMRVRQLLDFDAFEDNSTYDESLLGQLMEHLEKCHEKTEPDFSAVYYPGRPVVCQYTDGIFYRAVVEEVHDDCVKLLYVDFGNSEKMQPDKIRLENVLSEIPIQCYNFILDDICPNTVDLKWPVKTLDYIHGLVVTKQCTVQIQATIEEGKPLRVKVTMDDGQDLGEHLVGLELAVTASDMAKILVQAQADSISEMHARNNDRLVKNAYLPMWDPYVGMLVPVVVTHTESHNQVYIQRDPCEANNDPVIMEVNACLQRLETMTEELQTQAEFYPKLSDIQPGVACCALYKLDGRWYRGEVISIKTGAGTPQVYILFVDYGNKENVAPENVRASPDDMISLPAQASLVTLAGVCPPLGTADWLPVTRDILTEYVNNKRLIAVVKSIEGSIEVNLFEAEQFHEQCLEERVELLAYYPMLKSGLIQIHNVTEDGVIVEDDLENFT